LVARFSVAAEIEGVQPAALDQPRVHLHLRRELKGKPLAAGEAKEQSINIQAFLDTGASGIMLSKTTADALGVSRATDKTKPIVFHDVGVAGSDAFNISEPLFLFIAPFGRTGEPDDGDGYPISVGPVRAQIGPLNAGLMEMLTGGLDVVGMPAIKGRVIVIDPKPVDTFADTMRAGLFDKNAKNIPKTDRHIAVKKQFFARFTRVDPPQAAGPALADNPFIEGIVITMGNKKSAGSWLLDTGAAASMISTAQAEKLGMKQIDGKIADIPDEDQFALTVGGVGGAKKAPGFFLDTLTVPTREKDPLIYRRAPVLITDITVEDPQTKQKITLDGVFGMNFLVASAHVTESALLPDIGELTAGPFEWIVFDDAAGVLGLKLKPDFAR
jgi:hypothetical protein